MRVGKKYAKTKGKSKPRTIDPEHAPPKTKPAMEAGPPTAVLAQEATTSFDQARPDAATTEPDSRPSQRDSEKLYLDPSCLLSVLYGALLQLLSESRQGN